MGEDIPHQSVESFHKVGGIFGYCDFLLERYRTLEAIASPSEGAKIAVFTKASLDMMKDENHPSEAIAQSKFDGPCKLYLPQLRCEMHHVLVILKSRSPDQTLIAELLTSR